MSESHSIGLHVAVLKFEISGRSGSNAQIGRVSQHPPSRHPESPRPRVRPPAFLATDAGLDAVALTAHGDPWFTFMARMRERVATAAAALDALVGTTPRYLGPPIELGSVAPPTKR